MHRRSAGLVLLVGGLLFLAACGGSVSSTPATGNSASTSAAPYAGGSRRGGFGRGRFRRGAGFLNLNAAAQYLGIDSAQLRQDQQQGRSLAQIAQAQGKSVQGLEQALLNAAKTRLDQAVSGGRMTAAQEQQTLTSMQQRLNTMVNRVGPVGSPQGSSPTSGN